MKGVGSGKACRRVIGCGAMPAYVILLSRLARTFGQNAVVRSQTRVYHATTIRDFLHLIDLRTVHKFCWQLLVRASIIGRRREAHGKFEIFRVSSEKNVAETYRTTPFVALIPSASFPCETGGHGSAEEIRFEMTKQHVNSPTAPYVLNGIQCIFDLEKLSLLRKPEAKYGGLILKELPAARMRDTRESAFDLRG